MINALIQPFANCVCILDLRCQCVVLVRKELGSNHKVLLAIQLAKGVLREETTYLDAFKFNEATEAKDETLSEVLQVLESFKDVMPPKLHKRFPPMKEVP